MKKIIFIIFISLGFFSQAQTYKIIKEANGIFDGFYQLYDYNKEDIFGYMEVTRYDKVSPTKRKLKYKILDKNFNVIKKGEIIKEAHAKKNIVTTEKAIYNNGYILLFNSEKARYKNTYETVAQMYDLIDIKSNKSIDSKYFDELFEKNPKNISKLKKHKFKSLIFSQSYFNAEPFGDEGFYISNGYALSFETLVLGFDGKTYLKNIKSPYKGYWLIAPIKTNKNYIIFFGQNTMKKITFAKPNEYILVYDRAANKFKYKIPLFTNKYTLKQEYLDIKDDKIIIIGKYFVKNKKDRIKAKNALGFYKRVVDIKTGKYIEEIYKPYKDLHIPNLNEKGRFKREGTISVRHIDVTPQGNIMILAETYKGSYAKGLYTFLLDKNLNLIKFKNFITKPSTNYKFDFAQDLINNKGKLYIFYDKDNRKEYNIHFIIFNYADNSITEKTKHINLRKHFLSIGRAKKGYILMIEAFKKPKKGQKQMELRLEKID